MFQIDKSYALLLALTTDLTRGPTKAFSTCTSLRRCFSGKASSLRCKWCWCQRTTCVRTCGALTYNTRVACLSCGWSTATDASPRANFWGIVGALTRHLQCERQLDSAREPFDFCNIFLWLGYVFFMLRFLDFFAKFSLHLSYFLNHENCFDFFSADHNVLYVIFM